MELADCLGFFKGGPTSYLSTKQILQTWLSNLPVKMLNSEATTKLEQKASH